MGLQEWHWNILTGQVETSVAADLPAMGTWLEQINKAFSNWYEVTEMGNDFLIINQVYENQFAFIWQSQQYFLQS